MRPKPKKGRKVVRHLTDKELKQLLTAVDDGREKRILTVMLNTGMHPSVMAEPEKYEMELVNEVSLMWLRPKTYALCRWDFDDDKSMMTLVKTFTNNDVGYHRSVYHAIITAIAHKAGLKHISPITLRHTATVNLLKQGKTIEEVKKRIQCSEKVLWNHYAVLSGANQLGKEDDLE